MKPMRSRVKSVAYTGSLASLAIVLSYLEAISRIDRLLPVYGIKLGLSNAAVMIAALTVSLWSGAAVALVKVLVTSLLFGTPTAFAFSLSGALLSYLFIAFAVKHPKAGFSPFGISIGASALHISGQLLAASIILNNTDLLFMLPTYLLLSVLSGAIIGILTQLVLTGINKLKRR